MMGITYATTVAMPGDTFPVLIRKMAQKLGVTVDVGDNVYRVMWKVLANLDWVFGVTQSHVNVANQNVHYVTTPAQGDTLNVLFLKFAQRTGYVIIVRDGRAVPQSHEVLTKVILDPANQPGGGGTGIFYTLTYVNPFGPITGGANIQTVEGNLQGDEVTAEVSGAMSVTFSQWDDGFASPTRQDTVTEDATYTVEATAISYTLFVSSDGGANHDPGDDLEDPNDAAGGPTGGGWWSAWTVENESDLIVEDDFESATLGADVNGLSLEFSHVDGSDVPGAWVTVASVHRVLVQDTFETKTLGSDINGQTTEFGDVTWVAQA